MKIKLTDAVLLLSEKFLSWYEITVKSIPNILLGMVVFLIFLIFSKIVKSIVGKILPKFTHNQAVLNLFKTICSSTTIIIGLFISLEIMHLDKTVTSILAGAGVIGLALGFAFQEIASNFVSGILIAFKEPYQIGDIIELDNYYGEVTKISLRTTSITTFQGLEVIVPNKELFTKPFINLTTTPYRRLDLKLGVSYSDDLEKVERVTKEALIDIEERFIGKDVDVFFTDFDSSSINLVVHLWVKYPQDKSLLRACHKAIKNIKKSYERNNITIPFPIRTLDFGTKGEKLTSEVLLNNQC